MQRHGPYTHPKGSNRKAVIGRIFRCQEIDGWNFPLNRGNKLSRTEVHESFRFLFVELKLTLNPASQLRIKQMFCLFLS